MGAFKKKNGRREPPRLHASKAGNEQAAEELENEKLK